MLRDVLILCSCASVAYAWLCAVVAPVVRAVRSVIISRGALPLGLPDTLSPAPLRRRGPFAWLTRSARSLRLEQESRHAWGALALAVSGMLLWLVIVALAIVLAMMLEPRAGLALLRSHLFWPGLAFGTIVWGSQLALTHRMPRIGDAFEAATALAIVAVVNDDPETLARVHQMYARHAG
jgi:hypothetical protein